MLGAVRPPPPNCMLCKAVETLDHALGGCQFHKEMTAVLQKVWEPVHIKGQQYESGNIPTRYTFGSPQGIAQWAALAAHWTFRNTYRRGGMPTLDALLTIWVKFTALLVGWEPLAEYSHVFQLFHDRLVQFGNTGVVSGPNIVYAESCGRKDHRAAKRHRKDGRKQELAIVAMQQIQEAQHRGLVVLYTDGSAELVGGVGLVAGYGCHEPGMWEEANHLPVGRKQTINRAELMAVIVAVRRTHTRQHTFAVATDSSYVYGGVQGAAIKWRAQQWVTNKGPVLNVDLWIDLLELLDQASASYEWIKVLSHVQTEGNERAYAFAELGRKSSPLYARAGRQPQVLLTPIVISPIGAPDRLQ